MDWHYVAMAFAAVGLLVWAAPYALMFICAVPMALGVHFPCQGRAAVTATPEYQATMTRRGLVAASVAAAVYAPIIFAVV